MSEPKPSVKFSPRRPFTHSELIVDFVDLPPNTEFSVNITGPNPQPWWGMLKSDGIGQAQLIWRTQAAGQYHLKAKGDNVSLSEDFEIHLQDGEAELYDRGIMAHDADVKTVNEPGDMGDTPSREMKAETESDNPDVDDPQYQPAKGPTEKAEPKKKAAPRKRKPKEK